MSDPLNGLEKLGLEAWPGTEPYRDVIRDPYPLEHFQKTCDGISARLRAAGEQGVSPEEFYALRCYTGPRLRR